MLQTFKTKSEEYDESDDFKIKLPFLKVQCVMDNYDTDPIPVKPESQEFIDLKPDIQAMCSNNETYKSEDELLLEKYNKLQDGDLRTRKSNLLIINSNANIKRRKQSDKDSELIQKKIFRCHECNKSFIRKSFLMTHIRTHTGDLPHSCSICSKAFPFKSLLVRHLRSHNGERPYSCSMCNKTYTRKEHYDIHLRIHTGVRPYCCKFCEKSFNHRNVLSRHIRIHTGDRPYTCSLCGRSFTQGNDLDRHMRLHTGERPYSCRFCNKSFTQKINLQSHARIHKCLIDDSKNTVF